MIQIGSNREVFWDDYLIDTAQTTVTRRLHSPVRRECVMRFDRPWEGDGCDYQNILNDDGLYRMYYLGWNMISEDKKRIRKTKSAYATPKAATDCIGNVRISVFMSTMAVRTPTLSFPANTALSTTSWS